MIAQLKDLSGLLIYVFTGLFALIAAAFLSTQFIGRAISQTNTPSAQRSSIEKLSGTQKIPAKIDAPPPPPAAPIPGAVKAMPEQGAVAVPTTKANPLADIIEDYTYSAANKRDPFQPFEKPHASGIQLGPLWPLQRFDLDQLKLVGIIWDVKSPKAMILDPTGKGYVVTVNERIGRNNGYIARIREGEIIVVESLMGPDGKLSYQTKLVKIQTE